MVDTVGCAACFATTADEAWAALGGHERRQVVVQETHFSVVLLACRACGQRFVDVFCERIDWQGGEDPQAWLVAPVAADEARALVAAGEAGIERAIVALEPKRRCLVVHHDDGPKRIAFQVGPYTLAPHD